MIEVSQIDLADLIQRDGVALKGQKEKFGKCPKCGGTDRFHLRSYNNQPWFFCRQCHDQRGDSIEYLRWTKGDDVAVRELAQLAGVSDRTAARFIAARVERDAGQIAADALRAQFDAATERRAQSRTTAAPAPKPTTATGIEIPEALEEPPSSDWQAAALAFVAECEARLWSEDGAATLAYLRDKRGLSDEAIQAARLGWHWPEADRHGVKLAGQWWAARGITIPRFYAGELWACNVRRSAIDYKRIGSDGKPIGKKLMLVSGSKAQLYNADTLAGDVWAVVVCAGEFDCILAQQHAPAGVACITFGSESKGLTWEAEYLLRGKSVYIAFDNDDQGEKGAAKWAAIGQRAIVPSGKDITDFHQGGGDVAAWLADVTGAPAPAAALSILDVCRGIFERRGTVQHAEMPDIYSELSRQTGASFVDCCETVRHVLFGNGLSFTW